MCLDCEIMSALMAKAERLTESDGIPRYVTKSGHIMKCDWELESEDLDNFDGTTLEEHIKFLLEQEEDL